MPSIKDFENKANKVNAAQTKASDNHGYKKKNHTKRRPGRDASAGEEVQVEVMDAEEMLAKIDAEEKASAAAKEADQAHGHEHGDQETDQEIKKESVFKKINLHVPGTDVTLTFATPEKVIEIADLVIEDWKKDGSFEALPLGSPVAQLIAAKVLRKAKDIEKKLDEKGIFVMAQMGMDYIKSKLKK